MNVPEAMVAAVAAEIRLATDPDMSDAELSAMSRCLLVRAGIPTLIEDRDAALALLRDAAAWRTAGGSLRVPCGPAEEAEPVVVHEIGDSGPRAAATKLNEHATSAELRHLRLLFLAVVSMLDSLDGRACPTCGGQRVERVDMGGDVPWTILHPKHTDTCPRGAIVRESERIRRVLAEPPAPVPHEPGCACADCEGAGANDSI